MNLDLRIPLGWMFTLIGLLLSFFGWATNGKNVVYAQSLGININLWWGLALLVFGLILMALGKPASKQTERELAAPVKGKKKRER
jgi:uncharacterized membrane protein